MYYAKSPNEFSDFVTKLCEKISEIIIRYGGIIDNFTGDGLLAFFPEFYSGEDAGYRAILAASDSIAFFNEHYRKNRSCFQIVKADTGLGVGIDFGKVHLVNISKSLSVVWAPVVCACRLSSIDAGTICVNQSAKEFIESKYNAHVIIEETEIDAKGFGKINAYKVRLKGKRIEPSELPWRQKPANESTSIGLSLPEVSIEKTQQ